MNSWVKTKNSRLIVTVIVSAGIWLVLFRLHGILHSNSNLKTGRVNRGLKTGQYTCPENKYRGTLSGILRHWEKAAELHNISYVIGLGSLLGLHKKGDIIAWDDDVDVLVDIMQYQKLRSFAEDRSFVQGWDKRFRMVVQPDFERRTEKKRRRFTCYGKVWCFPTLGTPGCGGAI